MHWDERAALPSEELIGRLMHPAPRAPASKGVPGLRRPAQRQQVRPLTT